MQIENKKDGLHIKRGHTGIFFELKISGEADNRLCCLPLSLFGYFLSFLGESSDDANVMVVNYNFSRDNLLFHLVQLLSTKDIPQVGGYS